MARSLCLRVKVAIRSDIECHVSAITTGRFREPSDCNSTNTYIFLAAMRTHSLLLIRSLSVARLCSA